MGGRVLLGLSPIGGARDPTPGEVDVLTRE